MQSQQWIKRVNLSRNQTQLTYFASLSLKAGKLNLFYEKTRFLNYRDGKIRAKCSPQSRLRETAQQLTEAAGLTGKMNSHVVLIMRSSMFNRSPCPQSPYLKLPIKKSSSALHFEKFGKVQKFDKKTFFNSRHCCKFQQFSRKQYKHAKAPIDLMLHMHLPVTQSFKTP